MAKKLIRGGAIIVVWHVDNLKVSHKDPFEVTKFDQYLLMIYGNNINVHRGNIHYYLGMDLDYSETGVVKVSIIK